jgi:hypothetical protein
MLDSGFFIEQRCLRVFNVDVGVARFTPANAMSAATWHAFLGRLYESAAR